MIVDALREVGAARSGVIDEEGRILAGNATWEALAEAGIERVKVVEADGEEWVVVKRSGLTEEQKRRPGG
jgi:ParB-like chromosome segregation protein Spo0J